MAKKVKFYLTTIMNALSKQCIIQLYTNLLFAAFDNHRNQVASVRQCQRNYWNVLSRIVVCMEQLDLYVYSLFFINKLYTKATNTNIFQYVIYCVLFTLYISIKALHWIIRRVIYSNLKVLLTKLLLVCSLAQNNQTRSSVE